MIVWVDNGPDILMTSEEEITAFIDKHVTCKKDDTITELINYQTHRHARTCRKKGKAICRFNYPIPPMSKTVILHPIDSSTEQICIADCKKNFDKIAQKLDDMKYGSDQTFSELLAELNLTEKDYINAIRSSLQRDKVFLKRKPSEIRIKLVQLNHVKLLAS